MCVCVCVCGCVRACLYMRACVFWMCVAMPDLGDHACMNVTCMACFRGAVPIAWVGPRRVLCQRVHACLCRLTSMLY